jgi:hypothetical protein
VGCRDLEITFLVSDAETHEPIAAAEINVPESRSHFCEGCDDAFKLVTDDQGMARRRCSNCMCFGYAGGAPFLRRLDTYGSHTPSWEIFASAPGYQRSERIFVGKDEFLRTLQRGNKFATMQVSIKLQRLRGRK